MDADEFRIHGKEMVDYVADYWDNIRQRKPLPDVQPGYIRDLIPTEAPNAGEEWETIFADLEKVIMNANTHWQHPHFFAYFPTAISYQAIMGDMLSGGLGSVGFTWKSSPSMTELEMVVMDWMAKMLQLPEHFYNAHDGHGAGMIQNVLFMAKFDYSLAGFIRKPSFAWKEQEHYERVTFPGLVAYCSKQAHSSVERAALLAAVRLKQLPTKKAEGYALTGETLEAAIEQDLADGNIPFYVCATVGTTNCCAIDRLRELGTVCAKYGLWLHVDAAYAGSAAICDEFRNILDGVELVDTFSFNAHKWLMVNFDCSCMWFRDTRLVEDAFLVDPLYLKHEHTHKSTIPDFKNWQIPLGRRFRSLKLWFVLRSVGINRLQEHIRTMVKLGDDFGKLVESDDRFELFVPASLGLVCFRLQGANSRSESLLNQINEDGRIHMVPSQIDDTYFLRLSIASAQTNSDDVKYAWAVIQELAQDALDEQ